MDIAKRFEFKGEFEGFIYTTDENAAVAFKIIDRYFKTSHVENGYVHNLGDTGWMKAYDGSFEMTVCSHEVLKSLYAEHFNGVLDDTYATSPDDLDIVVVEHPEMAMKEISYACNGLIVKVKHGTFKHLMENLDDLRLLRVLNGSAIVLENAMRTVEVVCNMQVDSLNLDMREIWRDELQPRFEHLADKLESTPFDS